MSQLAPNGNLIKYDYPSKLTIKHLEQVFEDVRKNNPKGTGEIVYAPHLACSLIDLNGGPSYLNDAGMKMFDEAMKRELHAPSKPFTIEFKGEKLTIDPKEWQQQQGWLEQLKKKR